MLAETSHSGSSQASSHGAMQRPQGLQASWTRGQTLINVRGDASDTALCQAITALTGLDWPLPPCSTRVQSGHRGIWAGPDDWFLMGPGSVRADWLAQLRDAFQGRHAAVTDVSSGYAVLSLQGPHVRDLLAQGCPVDLHPEAFKAGDCVGTHFFKASVWMWQTGEDRFELLVRSSFAGYVQSMLNKCALEDRLVWV